MRALTLLVLTVGLAGCTSSPSFERIDDVGFVDVGVDAATDAAGAADGATLAFGCSLLTPDTCVRLGTVCCVPDEEVCVPSLGRPNRCMPAGIRTEGQTCSALDACASLLVCVAAASDTESRCHRVCAADADCETGSCEVGVAPGLGGVGVCREALGSASAEP